MYRKGDFLTSWMILLSPSIIGVKISLICVPNYCDWIRKWCHIPPFSRKEDKLWDVLLFPVVLMQGLNLVNLDLSHRCAIDNRPLSLSEPVSFCTSVFILWNVSNNYTYFIVVLWEFEEEIYLKLREQYQAHSKHLEHISLLLEKNVLLVCAQKLGSSLAYTFRGCGLYLQGNLGY
jgi:hypothetical protein